MRRLSSVDAQARTKTPKTGQVFHSLVRRTLLRGGVRSRDRTSAHNALGDGPGWRRIMNAKTAAARSSAAW